MVTRTDPLPLYLCQVTIATGSDTSYYVLMSRTVVVFLNCLENVVVSMEI